MTKEVAEMIQQYAELVCDHNFSDSIATELVKAVEFRRIADALGSISRSLESIDQTLEDATEVLMDCQVKNQYDSAIAVTGAIQQI